MKFFKNKRFLYIMHYHAVCCVMPVPFQRYNFDWALKLIYFAYYIFMQVFFVMVPQRQIFFFFYCTSCACKATWKVVPNNPLPR